VPSNGSAGYRKVEIAWLLWVVQLGIERDTLEVAGADGRGRRAGPLTESSICPGQHQPAIVFESARKIA
jgi:hypothetical protein